MFCCSDVSIYMGHRELLCGGTTQSARKSGAKLNVSCFYKAHCIEYENGSACVQLNLTHAYLGALLNDTK